MSDSLAEITRRLHREFPAVPLLEVIELARRCRAQIDTGAPEDCIPELVERLARVRLTERADTASDGLAASGYEGS